jgi:hypothetical protein
MVIVCISLHDTRRRGGPTDDDDDDAIMRALCSSCMLLRRCSDVGGPWLVLPRATRPRRRGR